MNLRQLMKPALACWLMAGGAASAHAEMVFPAWDTWVMGPTQQTVVFGGAGSITVGNFNGFQAGIPRYYLGVDHNNPAAPFSGQVPTLWVVNTLDDSSYDVTFDFDFTGNQMLFFEDIDHDAYMKLQAFDGANNPVDLSTWTLTFYSSVLPLEIPTAGLSQTSSLIMLSGLGADSLDQGWLFQPGPGQQVRKLTITGGGVPSYGGGYLMGFTLSNPEPGTLALFIVAGLALLAVRLKQRTPDM